MSEESPARGHGGQTAGRQLSVSLRYGKANVFLHCARDFRDKNLGQNSSGIPPLAAFCRARSSIRACALELSTPDVVAAKA